MTEFDEFENRLQRYRPVAPPPGLRDRVLTPRRHSSWIAWLPAAAAAIAIIVVRSGTSATYAQLGADIQQPRLAAQTAALDEIATILDDDQQARAEAERLMNVQHDAILGDADTSPVGGGRR